MSADHLNPVIAMLSRRLRIAVIGRGHGSFIGETHRRFNLCLRQSDDSQGRPNSVQGVAVRRSALSKVRTRWMASRHRQTSGKAAPQLQAWHAIGAVHRTRSPVLARSDKTGGSHARPLQARVRQPACHGARFMSACSVTVFT
jgi:hypothetical protein